jgi:hypothetical protein
VQEGETIGQRGEVCHQWHMQTQVPLKWVPQH